MRVVCLLLSVCQAAALQSLVLRHHMSPARPRLLSPRAQQGPLEDGFKGLMPLNDEAEGNVEPELVARVQQEVRDLMGVELEDLLNPSKVVNLEREKIVKERELASCTDAEVRAELETRLEKIDGDLFREKRTVFQGWLKGLFISQSVISLVLSGYMVFDAFPTVTIDISLRALGFWSFWLFIIPSLRARRPRGMEKRALDWAFLGSPLLTIGLPFVAKDPPLIWCANLALLIGCYGVSFAMGESAEPEAEGAGAGKIANALKALDFGSGRERGMRSYQREKYQEQQQQTASAAEVPAAEKEATPIE